MLGIRIVENVTEVVGGRTDGSSQRTRQEVICLPNIDARLPFQSNEQTTVASDMGRNTDSAPTPGAIQQLQAILASCRRKIDIVMDAAFTDEPFKVAVLIWIKQAEKMHTVLGGSLESAKGEYARSTCCLDQTCGVLDPVVISDSHNLYSKIKALLDDGRVVVGFICKGCLLVMTAQIGKGVYLQCTAIEARNIGQAKGLI